MKKFYNALNYTIFLIFLTIIFYSLKIIIKKYDLKLNFNIKEIYFQYLYIFFFAVISGLLLFFGFKNFNEIIYYFLKNKSLSEVASSTIVIGFSFLYSAYFQDILELLFGVKIELNVWKNIIGYILGRLLLISIIYFIN